MFLVWAVLLLIFTNFLKSCVKLIWRNGKLSRFPSPSGGYLLIGHALELTTNEKILPTIERFHQECGDVACINIGPIKALCVTDVAFFKRLLGFPFASEKAPTYFFFRRWFGNAMGVNNGEPWAKLRKTLDPAFRVQYLKKFVEIFNNQSKIMLTKLTNDSKTDSSPIIAAATLDMIAETTMGFPLNTQIGQNLNYAEAIEIMKDIIGRRIFTPLKYPELFYRFTEDCKSEEAAVKTLNKHSEDIIRKRKEIEDADRKEANSLIDIMLQSHEMSEEHIQNEVNLFLFGVKLATQSGDTIRSCWRSESSFGHDTVSSGLTFFFYCMAKYQDIQTKIKLELEKIFGTDRARDVTFEDLQEMKYTEMALKESLRIFTPVPFIFRSLIRDIVIDDKQIPKGTLVILNIGGLHKNPKYYPEPEKFDPERFSTERQSKRSLYTFLPFSAGSRNCIGQKYGMMKMKTVVSHVLRNFNVQPVLGHEPRLRYGIVVNSENGVPLRFVPRENY